MAAERKGGGEAIREISASRRATTPALARVLADKASPPALRAAAAVELGRGAKAPDKALIAALADPEPTVLRRAAEALGRAGGPEAATALSAVKAPADPAAARALGFARLLHAARHGLVLKERPSSKVDPARFEERMSASLEPAAPSPRQLAQLKAVLATELPGLPVAPEGAVALSCGANRFLVVPHARVAAITGSGVPAVVLKRAQSLDAFSLFLYILAAPAADGRLALTAWRTDGSLAAEGEAVLGRRPHFTLHALDTLLLPPIRISGALEPGGPRLVLETARVAAPVKDRRHARTPAVSLPQAPAR